ncbi:putative haloacid dehalogenase-like hydrolase [Aspergillus clavatus NRRL 1]|uniref:HAD superfamily hydrolase, putative n=1 Tax=Aspergillus clavatus (strain ATCC 1007 / CBS 513.65 / DSM 816 / NCTC 3887 / NRRL 1 / QM 1276 / 107) TaxID=344612 RepID=A1CIP6_ASPCL|nr:HAD superfamily hydrolase, putative [Aspergillus clavatus NRRL 1]EAW10751.1 HAD superfamily hydrolase, putative [Aspergillus clavatus NRRL 1]
MVASLENYALRQRRFAPLNPALSHSSQAPRLKGIVFDVDGTLCLPQNYMFAEMRAALGIDKKVDILHHIRQLPTHEERTAAAEKVKAVEREAMKHQQPQPGLVDLMDYLQSRGLYRALCTRNFEAPVMHLLQNHLPAHVFLPIITRETPGLLPKPDPAGILHIAREWGLDNRAENMIMVGDSLDDMTAGHTAGAATVLLLNEHNMHLKDHAHTDLCIDRLDDLIDILENGFVGHQGSDKPPTTEEEG